MKLIVITTPHFFQAEAEAIRELFRTGLQTLHLRKPGATEADVCTLLEAIPAVYHNRIVTHEHFQLAARYGLQGIHLNGRNPTPPEAYSGQLSCSCHSFSEVQARKPMCRYVFLSPIFHSLSKEGYRAVFTDEELQRAHEQEIIDEKVIALGGITPARLPEVKAAGFGGAALLGDVWAHCDDLTNYFTHIKELLNHNAYE